MSDEVHADEPEGDTMNEVERLCRECGETWMVHTAYGQSWSLCPDCRPPEPTDEPEGDEVRQKVQAACDCNPGEELTALERMIDYYDGMQAWIEHHFGNVADEIVLEDPYHEPDPSTFLSPTDEHMSEEHTPEEKRAFGKMFRDRVEPVSREGDREREVGRLMIEALDFMDEPTLQDFVERLARELTPDPSRMTENVGLVMGLDRFKQAVRKAERLTHADARSEGDNPTFLWFGDTPEKGQNQEMVGQVGDQMDVVVDFDEWKEMLENGGLQNRRLRLEFRLSDRPEEDDDNG